MSKALMIGCVLFFFTSCANDGKGTEEKLDSLEQKIDTTLDRAADSLAVKAKVLSDKVRSKLREAKDTLQARDSIR
ncbi:MAG TPA: hypothetical protein VM843_06635 [Flavisolibacter sp.]|nr:hypothetical protein [Flavisolibacter sp.]